MIGFKDWYDDWVYLYQDKKKKSEEGYTFNVS